MRQLLHDRTLVRRYVPLLVFDGFCREGRNLGIRTSYADAAATIGHVFGIADPSTGKSFFGGIALFQ